MHASTWQTSDNGLRDCNLRRCKLPSRLAAFERLSRSFSCDTALSRARETHAVCRRSRRIRRGETTNAVKHRKRTCDTTLPRCTASPSPEITKSCIGFCGACLKCAPLYINTLLPNYQVLPQRGFVIGTTTTILSSVEYQCRPAERDSENAHPRRDAASVLFADTHVIVN